MATLIAVYTSKGCIGRCDAKCYNAKTPDCDCVCGGKNHGCGEETARDNTNEYHEKFLIEYTERKRLKNYIAEVDGSDTRQLSLLAFL